MEDLFARLGSARDRPRRASTWRGTSRSAAAQRIAGRLLGMRDAAFAELGDTNLADLTVQGDAPAFTPGAAACPTTDAAGRRDPARVAATFTVPCFLDQPGCPTGLALRLRRRQEQRPGADPRQHDARQLRLHRARRRPTRPARPALYGHGLLGEASEVDLAAAARDGRATTTSSTAPPTGRGWRRRTCRTSATILNDLSRFPTLTDRLPAGDPQLPLPRPPDDPPATGFDSDPPLRRQDRHAAAVLRRQQPGRDLRAAR